MKIFVSASYSSKIDPTNGKVLPEHREYLERIFSVLEKHDHSVFCALRADGYVINQANPDDAFRLDMKQISGCDVLLAIICNQASVGVQTEVGIAVGLKKKVVLAHEHNDELAYFNKALIRAGVAHEVVLPLDDMMVSNIFGTVV